MLVIPGECGKETCEQFYSRRELLRIGGSGFLGLTLADILAGEARAKEKRAGSGFGKAKSVILVYLQGGPSHLDLWDPKENVPDNTRSVFKPINTKLPGVQFTELLPKLAQVNDKFTMIRSISYTPIGLLNHTAAIYQLHTGFTADKVSPTGQLEPPSPADYPTMGSNIVRLKPPDGPMLPFVMLPRPLQESNVIGKGGTAGFLGRAYDPYTLFPAGDNINLELDQLNVDDLKLRTEISSARLERRARLRDVINSGMPALDQAVSKSAINEYYGKALGLVLSGRAREAFDLRKETPEMRERYGRNTFGQSLLLARRLVEAGTRFVEVIWPRVANSDNHSWDVHTDLSTRMKTKCAPPLDAGLSSLFADLDERGLLNDTLVVALGEFGRSPIRGVSTSGNGNTDDGRDHWPYCYTAIVGGAGAKRGFVYGKSDKTGSSPADSPVHPVQLVATVYHSVGLDPSTIIYNHLNQPREMVQADVVDGILA
ncbi:MAG: DUF1501 domain-containing protein [Planctomycetia bacterium]|nr:DUF1501 domain-containing protein [Planctomycetia bacterium]